MIIGQYLSRSKGLRGGSFTFAMNWRPKAIRSPLVSATWMPSSRLYPPQLMIGLGAQSFLIKSLDCGEKSVLKDVSRCIWFYGAFRRTSPSSISLSSCPVTLGSTTCIHAKLGCCSLSLVTRYVKVGIGSFILISICPVNIIFSNIGPPNRTHRYSIPMDSVLRPLSPLRLCQRQLGTLLKRIGTGFLLSPHIHPYGDLSYLV